MTIFDRTNLVIFLYIAFSIVLKIYCVEYLADDMTLIEQNIKILSTNMDSSIEFQSNNPNSELKTILNNF